MKAKRLITLSLITAAVVGGCLWLWNRGNGRPPQLVTTLVERGDLRQVVTATGDLQPVVSVEVGSQISGLITEVNVDYNSPVEKDQILARIDPATYQSRLRQAEAELSNTRANHDLVKLNAARIQSLRERDLVSQQELDEVQAQLSQVQAQLLIRTAAVDNAKVDLARCTIRSPIDGLVLNRQATVGKTVAASLNAPVLFTLVNDLARMQIEANIAEADIGKVREGQTATFTVDAFPEREFQGVVRQIRNAPLVEQNVVTYTTIVDVTNDDLTLKPGMTANIAITIEERKDVLLVANSALRVRIPETLLPAAKTDAPAASAERGRDRRRARQDEPATRTVYLSTGTADKPAVSPATATLGISDGIKTEVLSGLEAGAPVVTSVLTAEEAASATATNNPFGGGGGMRPRRF